MISRLVVMAKVPEAGRVKTRLIPRLGGEGAARLCAGMSADVFVLAQSLGIPWSIMVDGDPIHPWVQKLPVPWRPQQGADLGERLALALRGGGNCDWDRCADLASGVIVTCVNDAGTNLFCSGF